MNQREIAKMIPGERRKQILEHNLIFKAIAVPHDPHMIALFTVWKTYINPNGAEELDCVICLGTMLGHYKRMQPIFIELQREDELADL